MNIRRAIPLDATCLHELEVKSFTQPWSLNDFKNDLVNPIASYWVANDGGKIVGYIGLLNIVGEGHITTLAVSKEYRNTGIAKSLLQTLIHYSLEQKMLFIILEVRISNIVALNLYKNLGFIELSKRKNYYKLPNEDAIVMKLNLI